MAINSSSGVGSFDGSLTAQGGSKAAGIGGRGRDRNEDPSLQKGRASTITINGGTINATGGSYSAGIGGGDTNGPDDGGIITINGGNVTVKGGVCAAGIGS